MEEPVKMFFWDRLTGSLINFLSLAYAIEKKIVRDDVDEETIFLI